MSNETILEVPEGELYDLYSTLAEATEAASTGDPNTCASKAADAKEHVKQIRANYIKESQ